VTIPVELRRELGLEPGDRVEFVRENGSIQVRKAESIVRKLAGSIPSRGRVLSPEEIHEEAEKAIVESYWRRMGFSDHREP
jgi:AbrB family looped-hinge helix DNA binding protein